MREVSRAVARAAAAGVGEMPGAYLAALSAGGEDVGLSRKEELQLGALGLLVLALVRMPDLFLYCHVLEACDLDPSHERLPPPVVARMRVLSGAALRLAYRALESHALTPGEGSECRDRDPADGRVRAGGRAARGHRRQRGGIGAARASAVRVVGVGRRRGSDRRAQLGGALRAAG